MRPLWQGSPSTRVSGACCIAALLCAMPERKCGCHSVSVSASVCVYVCVCLRIHRRLPAMQSALRPSSTTLTHLVSLLTTPPASTTTEEQPGASLAEDTYAHHCVTCYLAAVCTHGAADQGEVVQVCMEKRTVHFFYRVHTLQAL